MHKIYLTNEMELPEIVRSKNNLSKENININFNINQDSFLNNTCINFEERKNNNNNNIEKYRDISSKKFKFVEIKIHKIRNKNSNNIFQRNLIKNYSYKIKNNKNLNDIKKNLNQKLGQKLCISFLNEKVNFNNKNNFKRSFTNFNKGIIKSKMQHNKSCFNCF